LTSRWLTANGCSRDAHENVVLVVSELVTNAVVHACTAIEFSASMGEAPDGARIINVEVHDAGVGEPRRRHAGDGVGGLGLEVVERLALAWGWHPTPNGKVVWADIACQGTAAQT